MAANITLPPSSGTVLEQFGQLFYVIDYRTTSFKHSEEIPNYLNDAIPLFMAFQLLEYLVLWLQNKKTPRAGDSMVSFGHGLIYETVKMVTRGFELAGYEWLYQYRVLDLDWDSPVTWWTAAIGVDFAYYWTHRAIHEVAVLWTTHQVHHSSEDYNLSTATRQSMFQRMLALGFHQPLALLGVPLPAIIVHMHFNLLFQYWIHTEIIGNCGPIEWIFNTASHHRVHHGSNPWCLDKNYAGYLIIWDRMFGTFEAEKDDEKIVYGLVDQPQTYNVMYLQFFYMRDIVNKCLQQDTIGNKLRALFYGPGWFPGTPRLGDLPPIEHLNRKKYDPKMPRWMETYIIIHFMITIIIHHIMTEKFMEFSAVSFMMVASFVFLSVGIVGAMYDGWWWAPLVEALRCGLYVGYCRNIAVTQSPMMDTVLLAYFAFSTLMWTSNSINLLQDQARIANKLK